MSSNYHSIAIKVSSLVVTKMADHSPDHGRGPDRDHTNGIQINKIC